jgi:hypothetical protein
MSIARITTSINGKQIETGMLTCVVHAEGYPDRTFALSCRHVLDGNKYYQKGVSLSIEGENKVFGTTEPHFGYVKHDKGYSHDAQFAKISNTDDLTLALPPIQYSGYIQKNNFINNTSALVMTSRGQIQITAKKCVKNYWLSYSHFGNIKHHLLICFKPEDSSFAPKSGDSGAALVIENDKSFLGMYIAEQNGYHWAIPAWELFNHRRYHEGNKLGTLTLSNAPL